MTRDEYLQRSTEFAARGQDLPQAKLLDMDVINIRSAKRQRAFQVVAGRHGIIQETACERASHFEQEARRA